MSTQIVVPVNKRDQLTGLLPYLQVLAKPGSKLVFLWPFREETSWMEVQLTAMQTQINFKRITTDNSVERQPRWVDEKVRSVRESLEGKGIVVLVQSYSGSLRSGIAAVRDAGTETVVLCRNHRVTARSVIARLRKIFRLLNSGDGGSILYLRADSQH